MLRVSNTSETLELPDELSLNTPILSAHPDLYERWPITAGLRELFANTLDQAIVTGAIESPGSTVQIWSSPGKKNDGKEIVMYAGHVKLATVVCKEKECEWVSSYEQSGEIKSKIRKCHSETRSTRVIVLTNFASHIPPKAFRLGVSTKKKNKLLIGNFGEGMKAAFAVLLRAGANVSVLAAGYTTRVFMWDGFVQYQHKTNCKTDREVVFQIVFPPEDRRPSYRGYDGEISKFDPVTYDPLTLRLGPDVNAIYVDDDDENGEGGVTLLNRDMVILDDEERGRQYHRGFFVSKGEGMLLSYNFGDHDRVLMSSRERNVIDPSVGRKTCSAMVSKAAKGSQSRWLQRILVDEYVYNFGQSSVELCPAVFDKDLFKLLQQQHRVMYPGTVLVHRNSEIVSLVASFRDLRTVHCLKFLDEGVTLVNEFVSEIRKLEGEEIEKDDESWASCIAASILHLTGAEKIMAVDFPGELKSKHVLWVDKKRVFVSQCSIGLPPSQLQWKVDWEHARNVLNMITCSMKHRAQETSPDNEKEDATARAFQLFHLLTTFDPGVCDKGHIDVVNAPVPPTIVKVEIPDTRTEGDVKVEMQESSCSRSLNRAISNPESGGEAAMVVSPVNSEAADTASPATRLIRNGSDCGSREDGEKKVDGKDNAEEGDKRMPCRGILRGGSGDRDDGDDESAPSLMMGEEDNDDSGDESSPSDVVGEEDSEWEGQGLNILTEQLGAPLATRKRTHLDAMKKAGEAEASRKKKHSNNLPGKEVVSLTSDQQSIPPISNTYKRWRAMPCQFDSRKHSTESPLVSEPSIEVEPSADSVVRDFKPNWSSTESFGVEAPTDAVSIVADDFPLREEAKEPIPSSVGPERTRGANDSARELANRQGAVALTTQPVRDEEPVGLLPSSTPDDNTRLPPLIHLEERKVEGMLVDLYRIAGVKDNDVAVRTMFTSMVGNRAVMNVIKSTAWCLKAEDVSIHFFFRRERNALRAFSVAKERRIFLNLSYCSGPYSVVNRNLLTTVATHMARIRFPSREVGDHVWLVDFRDWVLQFDNLVR